MAKQLIPVLKEGHSIFGKVVSSEGDALILETQSGDKIKLPMRSEFIRALEICDSPNPLLHIKMENGGYKIFEHDVWPDEIDGKTIKHD
jgi:hypothetical protein